MPARWARPIWPTLHGGNSPVGYSAVGPAARTTLLLGHVSRARTIVLLGQREYEAVVL